MGSWGEKYCKTIEQWLRCCQFHIRFGIILLLLLIIFQVKYTLFQFTLNSSNWIENSKGNQWGQLLGVVQTVLLSCTQRLWDQKPLSTVTRFSVPTQGPAQIQVGHIWLHLALALDISVCSPELPPGLGGRYTLLPWSAPPAFPHSYLLLWLLLHVLP